MIHDVRQRFTKPSYVQLHWHAIKHVYCNLNAFQWDVGEVVIIIIIIASSYIALFRTEGPLKALYRYIYYHSGHRIQAYPHTMYAHSPLPGEHSSQASFSVLVMVSWKRCPDRSSIDENTHTNGKGRMCNVCLIS